MVLNAVSRFILIKFNYYLCSNKSIAFNIGSKLYKYFFSSNYTMDNKTQYAGYLIDARVQQSPSYAIYLTSYTTPFYQIDVNGSIIRTGNQNLNRIVVADNGYVYGLENAPIKRIHKYNTTDLTDSPKEVDKTYNINAVAIKFSSFNRMIYTADFKTKWINAYDLDINRIAASSIDLNSYLSTPYSITLYNSGSKHLIYVGFYNGDLRLYDQLNGQLINPTDSTNFGSAPADMYINESDGCLVVALENVHLIQLWETDGATHKNTNKTLSVQTPTSVDFDQNGRLLVVAKHTTLITFS